MYIIMFFLHALLQGNSSLIASYHTNTWSITPGTNYVVFLDVLICKDSYELVTLYNDIDYINSNQ